MSLNRHETGLQVKELDEHMKKALHICMINQKYRVKFVLTNDLNSAIDYAREAVFSE